MSDQLVLNFVTIEVEYKTLSDPQKVELKSWRQKQRNRKNNGKRLVMRRMAL